MLVFAFLPNDLLCVSNTPRPFRYTHTGFTKIAIRSIRKSCRQFRTALLADDDQTAVKQIEIFQAVAA